MADATAKGERCRSWVLHLPWLNSDSQLVDSSLVLTVVTKDVIVERRGCPGANKVGDGASDDVLHDSGVGSQWLVSVGRVGGWFSQLVQRRGDGRRSDRSEVIGSRRDEY
jgi:hypothetical protein